MTEPSRIAYKPQNVTANQWAQFELVGKVCKKKQIELINVIDSAEDPVVKEFLLQAAIANFLALYSDWREDLDLNDIVNGCVKHMEAVKKNGLEEQ